MKRRAVTIVGGSLAGLACALAAARAGCAVDLYEAEAGLGGLAVAVDVVPNMLRDLVRLGVGDACVRSGFAYRRTSTIGQRGAPLFSLDAARLAGPRYPAALGMSWPALHAVLLAAAADAGVRVHPGARIAQVEPDAQHGALVRLAGGEPVHAGLVLLACGAASALRASVFQADAPSAGATEWFHFLARRPGGLDEALHAGTPAGDKACVLPVSATLAGVRIAPRLAPSAMNAEAMRKLLAHFPGPIGALAPYVDAATPITRRLAAPGLLPQPWARGAVLAVGDCAHALPSHFGQSAAQAIEDAVVLGDLLAQPGDLASIAQAFLQRRLPRVQQVLAITVQAARWDAAPETDTDLLQLARALDQAVRQPA